MPQRPALRSKEHESSQGRSGSLCHSPQHAQDRSAIALKVLDAFTFSVNRSKASVLFMGGQPTHGIFVILEGRREFPCASGAAWIFVI